MISPHFLMQLAANYVDRDSTINRISIIVGRRFVRERAITNEVFGYQPDKFGCDIKAVKDSFNIKAPILESDFFIREHCHKHPFISVFASDRLMYHESPHLSSAGLILLL